MKKLFLMTLALLALGSTVALADSMDLGWVGCRSSANNTSATLNDVTAAQFVCNDQANPNTAIRNLVASFKLTNPTYTTFSGATIQLDWITGGGATVPDWWDVANKFPDPNNCRNGGMARATVGTLSACANPYGGASQQGGEAFTTGLLGPGTYRIVADHVPVGGAPFVAAGTGGYAAMAIAVNALGSVDDLDPTIVLCPGCQTPVCFVLNYVAFGVDGVLHESTTATFRNSVTWMGGTGANCPGATPTRNATWGQVKALYR